MFQELKAEVESIKKEMVDLKKKQSPSNTTCTTDMDDLETLFSSLDENYSPSVTPTASCSNSLLSPPPPTSNKGVSVSTKSQQCPSNHPVWDY